ncbi:MAG: Holliday junction resolvase RuvX [Bacteroidia bacterium]
MPRLLAIDYGTKRVGIAVSDPLQLIAQGLTTVATKDCISFLSDYFQKEPVEAVVVGLPKRLDGTATDATALAQAFVRLLRREFPSMQIELLDERFTSKMAFQTLIDSGLKKKDRRDKALIDEVSATIILQDFMTMRKP